VALYCVIWRDFPRVVRVSRPGQKVDPVR
jgi:hypothetical protein